MRKTFSAVLAAGLLMSQVAAAQCVRPADVTALDVAGLKTKLMVTALTCNADTRYNDFVTKYRPELVNQDKVLSSYFSRAHGRQARTRQDDYVTQLANSQSQAGIKQGSLFCNRNLPTFDEVMALRSAAELTDYAAAKSVAQPISVSSCGNTPERAVTTASTAPRRSSKAAKRS